MARREISGNEYDKPSEGSGIYFNLLRTMPLDSWGDLAAAEPAQPAPEKSRRKADAAKGKKRI